MERSVRDLSLRDWENHLRRLAGAAPCADPAGAPEGFRAWIAGEPPATPATRPDCDELLWRCVADPAVSGWRDEANPSLGREALFPDLRTRTTIEVRTERELAGLHALLWLALRERDAPALTRLLDAADWHLEHTQPDNATNRAWAAHVFLLLASKRNLPDARLYAETLVHNCMVTTGAPEPLSALILRDAAAALDRWLDADWR
jgi:hypothetical protein